MAEDPRLIRPGMIDIHIGPMYSGKSDVFFMIDDQISQNNEIKIAYFKPDTDKSTKGIYSRARNKELPTNIIKAEKPERILDYIMPYHHAIGIDEAQFFGNKLTDVVMAIHNYYDLHIFIAGLATDFRGEKFGPMADIMSIPGARIETHRAVCNVCDEPADYTQRLINGKPADYDSAIVSIRGKKGKKKNKKNEKYEARCKKHHIVPGKPNSLSDLVIK